jgi:hypothetical protein
MLSDLLFNSETYMYDFLFQLTHATYHMRLIFHDYISLSYLLSLRHLDIKTAVIGLSSCQIAEYR